MKFLNRKTMLFLFLLVALMAPTVITNAQSAAPSPVPHFTVESLGAVAKDDCAPTPVVLYAVQTTHPDTPLEPKMVETETRFCLATAALVTMKITLTDTDLNVIVLEKEWIPAGETIVTAVSPILGFLEQTSYTMKLKVTDKKGVKLPGGKTNFSGQPTLPHVNTCADNVQLISTSPRTSTFGGGVVEIIVQVHVYWDASEVVLFEPKPGADLSSIEPEDLNYMIGGYMHGSHHEQLVQANVPFNDFPPTVSAQYVIGCKFSPDIGVDEIQYVVTPLSGTAGLIPLPSTSKKKK